METAADLCRAIPLTPSRDSSASQFGTWAAKEAFVGSEGLDQQSVISLTRHWRRRAVSVGKVERNPGIEE
jgi:hypothetical protein